MLHLFGMLGLNGQDLPDDAPIMVSFHQSGRSVFTQNRSMVEADLYIDAGTVVHAVQYCMRRREGARDQRPGIGSSNLSSRIVKSDEGKWMLELSRTSTFCGAGKH
jgi:hypothetical protein